MFSTTAGPDIWGAISSISADILGIGGIIVLLTILGIAKGKRVLIALLFSLYPSALLTMYFPKTISLGSDAIASLFLFIASTAVISYMLVKYMKNTYQERSFWRMLELGALSVTMTGLFVALLYHVVSIESLHNFGAMADTLFASPTALFAWLVAPLLAIPLFVRP